MKLSKLAFYAAAALVLGGSAVVAYLAFTFDARDYEPSLVELVKERTGRTLAIAGDIKLSFWPDLGIELGRVALSERDTDERFADIDQVRVSVKLVPLISRALVARELHIRGAHLRITRFEDGRLNIDDLFKRGGSDLNFDIEGVKVEASAVSYRDRARALGYEFSEIRLETGRIAAASDAPISLALHLEDAAHTFDLNAAVKARLLIDIRHQKYALHAAEAELAGRVIGLNRLNARASGDLEWQSDAGEVVATRFSAVTTNIIAEQTVESRLDASRIALGAQRASAEAIMLQMRSTVAGGTAQAQIRVPRIERIGDKLTAGTVSLDGTVNRGGYTFKTIAAAALDANLTEGTVFLNGLSAKLGATGGRLPRNGVSGTVSGATTIDARHEKVRVNVGGEVAESRFKAQLTIAGWAAPAYTFAAEIDELDIDRYGGTGKPAAASGWDMSDFEKVPATGTLRIGMLQSAGVKARNVTLMLKP